MQEKDVQAICKQIAEIDFNLRKNFEELREIEKQASESGFDKFKVIEENNPDLKKRWLTARAERFSLSTKKDRLLKLLE